MTNKDAWWRSGGGFRWCWPRFNVYTPADTRPRVGFNRYPYNVIGAAVVIFGRCWGVQWKRTKPLDEEKLKILRRLEEALEENERLLGIARKLDDFVSYSNAEYLDIEEYQWWQSIDLGKEGDG